MSSISPSSTETKRKPNVPAVDFARGLAATSPAMVAELKLRARAGVVVFRIRRTYPGPSRWAREVFKALVTRGQVGFLPHVETIAAELYFNPTTVAAQLLLLRAAGYIELRDGSRA